MISDELYIETEQHNVSVLKHIFLALAPHLALLFCRIKTAQFQQNVAIDYFRSYETFFEIRVDFARRLR